MTPERFRLIEDLFHRALERAGDGDGSGRSERQRFLDEACAGDDDLRRRVEALLRQHDPTSGFLDSPVAAGSSQGAGADAVGREVGGYRIVRLIASGGMGAVYEAEQERPQRRVALKVMRGGLGSERARRRFEFEAQVLASLRHPGIAQVYEVGVHEDLGGPVPYFVMELVHGVSITEHCRAHGVDDAGRIRLMVRVCEAVQHAHQRGVIHRDIKPSNILVERSADGTAGADHPKVIDFGIARLVAAETPGERSTLETEAGGVLGTLAYMSPEQCTPSACRGGVDTRSDVYSLGVVLYELLCGALPYDVGDATVAQAAVIIASEAGRPAMPSRVRPEIRGDLETILLKALERQADRRYQSAGELARDLERYLALEPIEARPPTALYQLRMFARRHRALVAGMAVAATVLMVATAVSTGFALRAQREAERAALEEARAGRRADFLLGALASANPWFPPAFSGEDLSDYEPWDEWQRSPWPYAGVPGRAASVTDILWRAAERVEGDFADDPATRARLSDTLGWTLQRMLTTERHPAQASMLALAESLLRDALKTRREMLGDTDEETIRSMMRLAEFLDYTPGKAGEGGRLYDEAWSVCREKYGEHDARTLHALRGWVNNHAFMHGHWEEGRARLERAVGWAMEPGSEPSAPVAITLAYGSFLAAYMRECDRAAAMAERAVGRLVVIAGEGNIRTAFAQQYAAQAMLECGRLEEAEAYARAAVAGQGRFFGEQSLESAHRLRTLGQVYERERKWAQVVEVRKRALGLMVGIRGKGHLDTIATQWELAEAMWFAGEGLEESERLALEAYEAQAVALGASNPGTLGMALRMAEAGLIRREFDRTLAFIEAQLRNTAAAPPAVRPAWALAFARLKSECLVASGRAEEARGVLEAALREAVSRGVTGPVVQSAEEFLRAFDTGVFPEIPRAPGAGPGR